MASFILYDIGSEIMGFSFLYPFFLRIDFRVKQWFFLVINREKIIFLVWAVGDQR